MDLSELDIRKYISQLKSTKWLGLAVHLQRAALLERQPSGAAVKCKLVKISIIVDGDGNPLFWTDPDITSIAPAKSAMNWLNEL